MLKGVACLSFAVCCVGFVVVICGSCLLSGDVAVVGVGCCSFLFLFFLFILVVVVIIVVWRCCWLAVVVKVS